MASPIHHSPHRRGFSLVEVLLAISLATFALLIIISLMPVGMSSLLATNRQIVETEIFNAVSADLNSTPFDSTTLSDYVDHHFPLYFDQEGVKDPGTGAQVFTVRCSLAAPEGSDELRRATISIGFQHDPSAPGTKSSVRTILLVNRGGA